MTCACKSIHRFPCLFPGETDFFPFDGREWCRFIPFTIWRNEYKCDPWMVDYLKEHPLLLRAPATLMSLTAIALIALFLLALRRRFKMD